MIERTPSGLLLHKQPAVINPFIFVISLIVATAFLFVFLLACHRRMESTMLAVSLPLFGV